MCAVPPEPRSLILGGTSGLGRAIAIEILRRAHAAPREDIPYPIVVGRRAETAKADPELRGAYCLEADLTDPSGLEKVIKTVWDCGSVTQVYWAAGEYHRGPFAEQAPEKTAHMLATHLSGPLAFLAEFHRIAKAWKEPYALTVIGSVFVHKPGKQHAVLAAAKAFKANFARVFSHEMAADLPGSRTLLVNPWAMKTAFFDGYQMDPKAVAGFMDPAEVAKIVLDQVYDPSWDPKTAPMIELTLDRDKDKPGGILKLLGPQPVKY